MHPALLLQAAGKRQDQHPVAALGVGEPSSSLSIEDGGQCFHCDTDALVSVLTASQLDKQTGECGFPLEAANGSSIDNFGE